MRGRFFFWYMKKIIWAGFFCCLLTCLFQSHPVKAGIIAKQTNKDSELPQTWSVAQEFGNGLEGSLEGIAVNFKETTDSYFRPELQIYSDSGYTQLVEKIITCDSFYHLKEYSGDFTFDFSCKNKEFDPFLYYKLEFNGGDQSRPFIVRGSEENSWLNGKSFYSVILAYHQAVYEEWNGDLYFIINPEDEQENNLPELLEFDFEPQTVDITDLGEEECTEVEFNFHITDEEDGLQMAQFGFTNTTPFDEENNQHETIMFSVSESNLISGDNKDGTYAVTECISGNMTAGEYKPSKIYLLDQAGNSFEISEPDQTAGIVTGEVVDHFEDKGFPTVLEVIKEEKPKYSNVAFLPGLKGSRLYKESLLDGDKEDMLWLPTNLHGEDIENLFLNTDGTSKNPDIYTKDIIDIAYKYILNKEVYYKFTDFIKKYSENKEIEFEVFPYDWRLSLDSIIDQGTQIKEDGENIMKLEFIVDGVKELAEKSATGKTTIITHSNGGLLVKVLVDRLGENASKYIDKILLVSSPQLGTPLSLEALLHADTQQLGYKDVGLLLNEETARIFGENMPSAYNLLPSEKYFEKVASPVLEFDSSVSKIEELRNRSNNAISNFDDMYQFLLGDFGAREKPYSWDIDHPNVVNNELLDKTKELRDEILDNWIIPEEIDVIQIVGYGQNTIKGIKYSCGFGCNSLSSLDRELEFTVEGDGTVVSPSAAAMNVPTYYFDLNNYNYWNDKNFDHADILEIEPLQDFIGGIITDSIEEDNLPENIFYGKPTSIKASKRIILKSPVDIDIYDENNEHVGLVDSPDEYPSVKFYEAKIPNSYYIESAGHKYVGFSGDENEEYEIKLEGLDLGTFTLEIESVENGEVVKVDQFIDIPVNRGSEGILKVSSNEIKELKLDVDGDGNIDKEVVASDEPEGKVSLEMLEHIIDSLDIQKPTKRILIVQINITERFIEKGRVRLADITSKRQ